MRSNGGGEIMRMTLALSSFKDLKVIGATTKEKNNIVPKTIVGRKMINCANIL